jgi:hypothetical protein
MTVRLSVERKGVEVDWDETGDEPVTVFAKGENEENWHNTNEMKNDGRAALSYPKDFKGTSLIEVRNAAGDVLDSGTVNVG